MNIMKIGLDFHGVIDKMPDIFAFLTAAIINAGGEVHIITGGTTSEDMELLEKYNIKYTHFFRISKYHMDIGTPADGIHPKYGIPKIDDDTWDRTKGEYCKKHSIDLHIDDTFVYNKYFQSPFLHFKLEKNED